MGGAEREEPPPRPAPNPHPHPHPDPKVLSAGEHFMCVDVVWDPTGRYVATAVTTVHQMENGYKVWAFTGRLLYQAARERFFQFLWRPRPPSLLAADELAAVRANLKKYAKAYEEEDAALLHEADAEIVAERRAAMDAWTAWAATRAEWAAADAAARAALLGERALEPEHTTATVEVEEVVNVDEKVLKPGEL